MFGTKHNRIRLAISKDNKTAHLQVKDLLLWRNAGEQIEGNMVEEAKKEIIKLSENNKKSAGNIRLSGCVRALWTSPDSFEMTPVLVLTRRGKPFFTVREAIKNEYVTSSSNVIDILKFMNGLMLTEMKKSENQNNAKKYKTYIFV